MGLETYQKKRDFRETPEPKGKQAKTNRHRFVVQEHHARKLHFDFRLEMGGVLKSWSVPRGPSLDPSQKRLAVPTEDHPIAYLKFEGRIPEGNYGAGEHMIWDGGTYELTGEEGEADPLAQLNKGRLRFRLNGQKLHGEFNFVRMSNRENQWLLMKVRDEYAEPGWELKLRMAEKGETVIKNKPSRKVSKASAAQSGLKKQSGRAKTEGRKTIAASRAFRSKELKGDIDIKISRDTVALTNLDKVYWPDDGYTKGDLIKYYYEIAKYILPYLKDRPLIMKRYPNGVRGPFFHQHDVNEAPDYVRTVTLDVEEGHQVDYIVGDNLATLLYMANLGAIERHPWHSRVRNLNRPDWIVFDLDPGAGIEYKTICELALCVRDALKRVGLESYPKTSGSRGMHVYVPIKPEYDYEQVAKFAEALATLVAQENPEIATVERALKKRQRGQIYVDHMQNARGKSVVAAYSVRPREGASVSAPLAWTEVARKQITPQDFTIKNILRRTAKRGDLFKPVLRGKQNLDAAWQKLQSLIDKSRAKRKASVG